MSLRSVAPIRPAGRFAPASVKAVCAVVLAASAWLSGCASAPAPVWSGAAPDTVVAQIRADRRFEGGQGLPAELDVQPLLDPEVEYLRTQAAQAEAAGRPADAAALLDRAIALSPDIPVLLQARAETALLLRDLDTADRLARDAHAIGAQVGPLCRRHWLTAAAVARERAAQRQGQAAASRSESDSSAFSAQATTQSGLAADAERRAEACMLTGPARY